MELKDFTRGIAPKPKPVIQRPTGFDVQRSPYAPVTPTVNMVRPKYTSSNPVNTNDRGGDRIQKMPYEMMFDPQIQYNLLTKPLAKKYGLEGPASLLNPQNYQYKNLADGVSKIGNTLGNVTNLMGYGTPAGALFSGVGQAASTANALGNPNPQNAVAGAGAGAMVSFAVNNILSKGNKASMAGQTILELTKLAGAFGKSTIVNTVKKLTGVDIGGYIDAGLNADVIANNALPARAFSPDTAVSNATAFPWLRGGKPSSAPWMNEEYIGNQIREDLAMKTTNPKHIMLPGITTRPYNLLLAHGLTYPSQNYALSEAIKRTHELGPFNPDDVIIRQDMGGIQKGYDKKPIEGHDIYLVELPNGDVIPLSSSTQTNYKPGVEERGSLFPFAGIQYTKGEQGMSPGWFMKSLENIHAANDSPYMQDLYNFVRPNNSLVPRLESGEPNTPFEHFNLQGALQRVFGRIDNTINYEDPTAVLDIMKTIQNYEYYQKLYLADYMKKLGRQQ